MASHEFRVKMNCIERSLLKLRPHQSSVVKYILDNRGLIVAHSLGSGKTLTAVASAICMLEKYPKMEVVIVTPKSLADNFLKGFEAYGEYPDDRVRMYTFQGFLSEVEDGRNPCGRDTFLIVDEAHNLRTPLGPYNKPNRSRAIWSCAVRAKRVMLLTATPWYNDYADVRNLVAMVRGSKPLSVKEFQELSSSGKRLEEYFEDVFSFYRDPMVNYPTVEEYLVRLKMPRGYYEEYMEIEKSKTDYFFGYDPWIFMTGLRQAVNMLEPNLKARWVVNKLAKGAKTLIYSAFVAHGIDEIKRYLDKDVKWAEIEGGMTQKSRSEAVERFNSDEVQVLFITKAGGEGYDLKGVRDVIIFESAWNNATEDQVIGRAVRYGSHAHLPPEERNVKVCRLVVVKPDGVGGYPSADEMLLKLSEQKQRKINKMRRAAEKVAI